MTVTAHYLNQQVIKAMRKDEADHQRIVQRASALGVAFDEGEVEELTTNDLAEKVLKKLGLEPGVDGRHLEALDRWLQGHEKGREAAADRRIGRSVTGGMGGSMDAADMPEWFTNITKSA